MTNTSQQKEQLAYEERPIPLLAIFLTAISVGPLALLIFQNTLYGGAAEVSASALFLVYAGHFGSALAFSLWAFSPLLLYRLYRRLFLRPVNRSTEYRWLFFGAFLTGLGIWGTITTPILPSTEISQNIQSSPAWQESPTDPKLSDTELSKGLGAEAEQGSADAQFELGLIYESGKGVPPDYAEAARWYRLAAEQGEVAAQINLGTMYHDGRGVTQDHAEAVRWFRLAAEQGDADAQFNLAVMYESGKGVLPDYAEAAQWYRLAAEQGHTRAQFRLALMFDHGKGLAQDNADAARWYRLAAEQGVADAQFNLALMYESGKGVLPDYAEAAQWYRLAAEQGEVAAQINLGTMYHDGRGVTQDHAEAVRWFRLAAEQGDADAQFNLAAMYFHGYGVTPNFVLSYMWVSLAAAQGGESARSKLAVLEARMTREQIAEAQHLAAVFQPRGQAVETENRSSDSSLESPESSAVLKRIQEHLKAMGYDPGPLDGEVRPQSTHAIKEFQRDLGIEPDGMPSTTLEALLAGLLSRPQGTAPDAPRSPATIGTGFYITDTGYVLTNNHVIEDCTEIRVTTATGSVPAKVQAADSVDDLGLSYVSCGQGS